MVFALQVIVVPLVKMMLKRNSFKFNEERGLYHKILSIIIPTPLVILFLLLLDIVFMILGLFAGIVINILGFFFKCTPSDLFD